jgi:hypothetical protein
MNLIVVRHRVLATHSSSKSSAQSARKVNEMLQIIAIFFLLFPMYMHVFETFNIGQIIGSSMTIIAGFGLLYTDMADQGVAPESKGSCAYNHDELAQFGNRNYCHYCGKALIGRTIH